MPRSDHAIEEIKQRLDLADYIGRHVDLKRAGRTYKARCPFHVEKTPSFVVFPHTNTWRCFGACGEGGDIFSYVQKREGIAFPDALRLLAREANVELEEESDAQRAQRAEQERLLALCDAAATLFRQWLLDRPDGEACRDYVARRGLSQEVVGKFALGYAPDRWDALLTTLQARGYEPADMLSLGLVRERDGGGYYDYFRDRLIFPIRDERGRTVGFGGRALQEDQGPKYLNSPQSPLFDKSRTLYGLDLAKEAIRRQEQGVVVEGYMDVIAAHQHGFTNVVAALGTALTTQQLGLLRRYSTSIVLALDADEAGQRAAQRGLETALALQRDTQRQRWSRAKQGRDAAKTVPGEVRVATMPVGKDPDDLLRHAPERWEELIATAQPVIDYMIAQQLKSVDLSDGAQKTQAVTDILPMIAELEATVLRDHYLQKVARLLQLDERTLAHELVQVISRPAPAPLVPPEPEPPFDGFELPYDPEVEALFAPRATPSEPPADNLEAYLLFLLLEVPELLEVAEAEALPVEAWQRASHRELYSALLRERPASGAHLEEFAEQLDRSLAELLRRIVGHFATQPLPDEEERVAEALKLIHRLLIRHDDQQAIQLQSLIDDLQGSDVRSNEEMGQLMREKLAVDRRKLQRQRRLQALSHA